MYLLHACVPFEPFQRRKAPSACCRHRSHSQPTRATRHGERKQNYKQGELSLSQFNSALQGVSTLLTKRTATSVDSSSKRQGDTAEFHSKSQHKIAIATDDARCWSTSKQNMTYGNCWAGPGVNRCPARVTGIALRSAREPHSGTRNLAARALQGE